MITPIMIAIIVDALRSVPQLDRGRGGARREPLARDVDDLGARRAPRDDRRRGARDGPRAGRGDHAVDGLRARSASRRTRSTASPSSSSRPGPLAATIVDNADGLSVEPFGETLYAFAAILLVSAMFLSLGGWAAKQPLKKYGAPVLVTTAPATSAVPHEAVDPAATGRCATESVLACCWVAGLTACLIAVAIVVYMLVRGCSTCAPTCSSATRGRSSTRASAGGFLDPLLGTFLLTVMGTALAVPRRRDGGVAVGVRASVLARARRRVGGRGRRRHAQHRARDLRADRVLERLLSFLSFTAEGGAVFGRSFFAASAMMALIALPLIVGATREALQAIPRHVREASYALGKTKTATIRRVLLPARAAGDRDRHRARHGPHRGRHRDRRDPARCLAAAHGRGGGLEPLDTLRGTGSTLTSYVFVNSPAGEGNAPEKAYAAAFVLLRS